MRAATAILFVFFAGCVGELAGPASSGAPADLAVEAITDSSARLRWRDTSDDEGAFLVVLRGPDDARWIEVATVEAGGVTHRLTGLASATEYRAQVLARSEMGVSPPSNVVVFVTAPAPRVDPPPPPGLELPSAPEGFVVADVTRTGAIATWTDTSDDEDRFSIEAWDGASGRWIEVAAPEADATRWVLDGLTPGTEHGMRVSAYNAAGQSDVSNEQWFTTLAEGPSCGDGTCAPGEGCGDCEADCGACPPTGGDWLHLTGGADFEVTDDFEGAAGSFWGHGAWTRRGPCESDPAAVGSALNFRFQPDPSGDAMSEQRFGFPRSVQVEMRYRIFVPPNYRHRDARGSDNNKGLFMFWSGPYTAANFACHAEHWRTPGGSQPSLHCYYAGRDYGHSYPGGRTFETEDGGWHDVRVFFELAEREGDFGRVIAYWDGAVILDNETAPASGGLDDWRRAIPHRGAVNFLDQGYLLGWSNSGYDELTVFCVDDFALRANATHR